MLTSGRVRWSETSIIFTDRNEEFASPFIYFKRWTSYPFTYLQPEKGTTFGRAEPPRIGHHREYPPPSPLPPWAFAAIILTCDQAFFFQRLPYSKRLLNTVLTWRLCPSPSEESMFFLRCRTYSKTLLPFYRSHTGSTSNSQWKKAQKHMDRERKADI